MIDFIVGHDDFSREVAKKMNKEFILLEEKIFPNNEIKSTVTNSEKIEGKNILLIIRMKSGSDYNADRCVVDTFLAVSNLKSLGAKEVHLCWPFLPYAKQDKVFLPGEPQSLKIIFDLLHKLGATSLFTIMGHPWKTEEEVHYSDLKIKNVFGTKILADYIKKNYNLKNAVIVSPDLSAGARAVELSKLLDLENKELDKTRDKITGKVSVSNTINVKGKDVIIVDDFISTGSTVFKAKELCKSAKSFKVIAMHGVFANDFLKKSDFDVVCSNSLDTPVSKIDIIPLIVDNYV